MFPAPLIPVNTNPRCPHFTDLRCPVFNGFVADRAISVDAFVSTLVIGLNSSMSPIGVIIMSVFFYAVDGVISWLLQSFLDILS